MDKNFIIYVIWKYLHLICGLFVHFLPMTLSFKNQILFYFNQSQFIFKYFWL